MLYLGSNDVLTEVVPAPEDVHFTEDLAGFDLVRPRLDGQRTAQQTVHHPFELRNVFVLHTDDLHPRHIVTVQVCGNRFFDPPISTTSSPFHPIPIPI